MSSMEGGLFFQRVYDIVARIPLGKVVTYGSIACYIGNPRNARMVGWAMHSCPNFLPWHRVILKKGKLPLEGLMVDGTSQKKLLLREGVLFLSNGFVDLETCLWQIKILL
jgi:methylated-DNA-protein-cysteine methyltransferase-like protein